jgi:hypothetical protein
MKSSVFKSTTLPGAGSWSFDFVCFLVLWGVSVFGVLMGDVLASPQVIIGSLGVLWGVFLVLRVLWLLNTYFDQRANVLPHLAEKKSLIHTILGPLQFRKQADRQLIINRLFDSNFEVLLFFGFLAFVFLLASWFSGLMPESSRHVSTLFSRFGLEISPFFFFIPSVLQILNVFMLVCAFFLAQTYAYDRKKANIMIVIGVTAGVLGIVYCVFTSGIVSHIQALPERGGYVFGHGPGRYALFSAFEDVPGFAPSVLWMRVFEIGWVASIALYGAGIVIGHGFYKALSKSDPRKHYAKVGFGVLAAALLIDLVLVYAISLQAVWLAIWGVLGTLWVRTTFISPRKYVMHQL